MPGVSHDSKGIKLLERDIQREEERLAKLPPGTVTKESALAELNAMSPEEKERHELKLRWTAIELQALKRVRMKMRKATLKEAGTIAKDARTILTKMDEEEKRVAPDSINRMAMPITAALIAEAAAMFRESGLFRKQLPGDNAIDVTPENAE